VYQLSRQSFQLLTPLTIFLNNMMSVSAGTKIPILRLFAFTVSFIVMRNCVIAFLVFGLLLPVFLPLAPHSAVHALYDAHIVHHVDSSHHQEPHLDKFHYEGNCFYIEHEDIPHHIPTDLASYYKDILHIDLKNADQNTSISKLISAQDFNYDLALDVFTNGLYELKAYQKRGPPNGRVFEPNLSSLYLTTLRIRI